MVEIPMCTGRSIHALQVDVIIPNEACKFGGL